MLLPNYRKIKLIILESLKLFSQKPYKISMAPNQNNAGPANRFERVSKWSFLLVLGKFIFDSNKASNLPDKKK